MVGACWEGSVSVDYVVNLFEKFDEPMLLCNYETCSYPYSCDNENGTCGISP